MVDLADVKKNALEVLDDNIKTETRYMTGTMGQGNSLLEVYKTIRAEIDGATSVDFFTAGWVLSVGDRAFKASGDTDEAGGVQEELQEALFDAGLEFTDEEYEAAEEQGRAS